ncbi:hypothetical protein EVAR_78591_1 [Eumeta japonica]|uniref:Uncharacterized protein n=1 Tax=Eumeta variegata TaxID=151549 RepID=A0A4C1U7Q5_EUMVA|nr:hypothetical protein EVAR_78591_1 [Eumeta japonica]
MDLRFDIETFERHIATGFGYEEVQPSAAEDRCVWYGICKNDTMKKLNCLYDGPPKPVQDDARLAPRMERYKKHAMGILVRRRHPTGSVRCGRDTSSSRPVRPTRVDNVPWYCASSSFANCTRACYTSTSVCAFIIPVLTHARCRLAYASPACALGFLCPESVNGAIVIGISIYVAVRRSYSNNRLWLRIDRREIRIRCERGKVRSSVVFILRRRPPIAVGRKENQCRPRLLANCHRPWRARRGQTASK